MSEQKIIEIPKDIISDDFKKLSTFSNSKNIELNMRNIDEVTRLTYKHQVTDCCNTCVEFLLTNHQKKSFYNHQKNDILWMYQLAIDINNEDFKNYCEMYISRNSKKVFDSDEFQHCKQNMLKLILQMDMLSCSEVDVFHACLTWAKCACKQNKSENIKQQLGDCFNLIRFGTIDTNEFIIHTLPYKDLFTREEYKDILYKTSVKFNQTARLNPHLLSNNRIFTYPCSRFDSYTKYDERYQISPKESVWFSTDVPILLESIWFPRIFQSNEINFHTKVTNVDFNLKVIDSIANAFKINEGKILYEGQITLPTNNLIFPQKLFIQADRIYEIRLEMVQCNDNARYYHDSTWKSSYEYKELEQNSGYCITFHEHPKKDKRHGLVEELAISKYFYKDFTYDRFKKYCTT